MELRALEPENFARLDALRRHYEAVLVNILKALPVEDPKVTAMAILGMLTGATTWYKPGGRLSAKEIENIYAQLALKCVGKTSKELANV